MSHVREQPFCHSTYNLCGCVQLPPLLALPLVSGFWLPWLRVGQTTGEDAVRAEVRVGEGHRELGWLPWLLWLLWPVVRHLCGLCIPQWGRGWTLLRPLLKDGGERGVSADRGAGTARTQTTGALSAGGLSLGAVWSLWPRKPSCFLWDSG